MPVGKQQLRDGDAEEGSVLFVYKGGGESAKAERDVGDNKAGLQLREGFGLDRF